MDTATLSVIDWSPFKEEEVCKLGLVDNWSELVRILGPLASPDFGVTDAASQALIDKARFTLDLSIGRLDGNLKERKIVELITGASAEDNPIQAIEPLLAVGANPDIQNGDGWRASHDCGAQRHVEVASVLFLCRPDMTATNKNGKTPLRAAVAKYKSDVKHPERKTLRQYVAKFIRDGCFETRFPTLVELAAQKKWVPMKNLLRRQVVKQDEFTEVLSGRTAAGWAQFFKEALLAIRYYLKQKEEKIEELSETVNVLSSKLADSKEENKGAAAPSAKRARISPAEGGQH